MDATVLYGVLQITAVVVVLVLLYRPLGDYIAHVYTSGRDLRIERGLYRVIGVDPRSEQTWRAYARSVLLFSLVGLLLVYGLQRLQAFLPASLGLPAVPEGLAFNTAASFVANTNWQSYSPEQTMGYTVQLAGLTVQNFVSAAVGLTIAIALIRGLARRGSATIGNFWVDLTRGLGRLLLPLALIGAVALLAGGVIQNVNGFTEVATVSGGTQMIPGGPVASQEAIKLLGTNGGGFFNANSAHPFENPTGWTNLLEVLLILVIPFALPRTFGRLVGDHRQGYAIVAVMGTLFLASLAALSALELAGRGAAPELAGAAMEGKEQRFGILGSTLFGLLVGRTPEWLGKRIGPREMTLASLYILVVPVLVLGGTALSFAIPGIREDVESTSILNPGVHGMGEVLYAFTSAANNNGSAFAGLTANTPWFNTALGVAMLLGRFLPIVLVLALAGSFAAQERVPATTGTLPTHRPQFAGLLLTVTVVVTALTYFPVLALGPLAEGL